MTEFRYPRGWILVELAQACSLVTDGTHHSPPNTRTGAYPYVTAKNIRPWGLDTSDLTYVSDEIHREIYKRCPVEQGDVLYIKDGVTTGLAAVNTLTSPFSILSSVALLKPRRSFLDPQFLKHWLNSPATFREMTCNMTGSAIRRLVLRQIRVARVPVPPLSEQRRVVEKIEALNAKSRRAMEALEALPSLLEKFRQSILAAAFRGELTADWRAKNRGVEPASKLLERLRTERRHRWEVAELEKLRTKGARPKDDRWKARYEQPSPVDTEGLPELPEGWCWGRIEEFLSFERTGMKTGPFGTLLGKEDYVPSGVPVIGIENIGQMHFVPGSKNHVSPKKATALAGYDAVEHDLLISRSGTVGEVCVVPRGIGPAIISTNVIRVALHIEALLPRFLGLAFTGSPFVLAQIRSLCGGSSRDFLNQGIMSKLNIPIPPFEEQKQIIANMAALDASLSTLAETHSGFKESLNSLNASILAKAFRGELVPQDYNDETASVLLERIRAEREAQAAAKNNRTIKRRASKRQAAE